MAFCTFVFRLRDIQRWCTRQGVDHPQLVYHFRPLAQDVSSRLCVARCVTIVYYLTSYQTYIIPNRIILYHESSCGGCFARLLWPFCGCRGCLLHTFCSARIASQAILPLDAAQGWCEFAWASASASEHWTRPMFRGGTCLHSSISSYWRSIKKTTTS